MTLEVGLNTFPLFENVLGEFSNEQNKLNPLQTISLLDHSSEFECLYRTDKSADTFLTTSPAFFGYPDEHTHSQTPELKPDYLLLNGLCQVLAFQLEPLLTKNYQMTKLARSMCTCILKKFPHFPSSCFLL